MRTLPDNQSLEYLRREAKDLLAALRETSPTSSLADAQRVLAEQYGFRKWPDLKAEVDRRRTRLPEPDQGLPVALGAAFGLGEVSMSPLQNDSMGRSWMLLSDRGRFAAWPVYEWVSEEQAETAERLRAAAQDAGVLVRTPVRSPAWRLVERVAERNWRVDEWTDAGPSPASPVRSAVARRVGETLGILHSLALPCAPQMQWFLTHRRPRADWDSLIERGAAGLEDALPTILELSEYQAGDGAEGLVLSHGNLIADSVRLGRGEDTLVLGWEFAGPQVPAWELGNALVQWALRTDGSVNVAAVRALLDGYRERAGLCPEPRYATAIAGWLNWAYTNICTTIEAPDPDTHRFAKDEARGMLAHPLSVATLERLTDLTAGARA